MTLSMEHWHQRYKQQSKWTRDLRDYIYKRIKIENFNHVLEVGSGTGVLLEEMSNFPLLKLIGLDIDYQALSHSQNRLTRMPLVCGDAYHLPFNSHSFEVVYCHFFLLWVNDPGNVISEMVRVTAPGGYILALAEPDYGGRIDYPEPLSRIGQWQVESLKKQGANPYVGRSLRALFSQANLLEVEVGLLGGQWKGIDDPAEFELEWSVIESDLRKNKAFMDEAEILKSFDMAAREAGQKILYVPTFYAIGKVR